MFLNREEAGKRLALYIFGDGQAKNASIVAIPRGGVVVGSVVSEFLKIPLSVLIVKKISIPKSPELAIGATGSDGIVFWDEDIVRSLNLTSDEQEKALLTTREIIKSREKRLNLKMPYVKGKTVYLVDDGVATGATVTAAALILKKMEAKKIILAVPVITKKTMRYLKKYFDKIIAVEEPRDFSAVGEFYTEFPQVEDAEVAKIIGSFVG